MPRKKGDPKRFTATGEQREKVEFLAAAGLTEEQIGYVLGVHKSTVSRHFRDEIKRGLPKSIANMAQSLYRQGIGGNVAAAIFWMKARAGWRETQVLVHEGKMVFDIAEPSDD